jgi:hypothetical protein
MNQDKIYVSFEREEKFYRGSLSPVSGAGSSSQDSYHLMIHNRYYGCLRKLDKGWVFNNQWNWNDLAEVLGKQVDEWKSQL